MDLSMSVKAEQASDRAARDRHAPLMETEGSSGGGAGSLNRHQDGEPPSRKGFIEDRFLAWTRYISSNSAVSSNSRGVSDDDKTGCEGVLNLVSRRSGDSGSEPPSLPRRSGDSGSEPPSLPLDESREATQDVDSVSSQPLNLCTSASRSTSSTDQDVPEVAVKQEPVASDGECDENSEHNDDAPSDPKKLRIQLAEIKTEPLWETASSVSTSSVKRPTGSVEFWCDWSAAEDRPKQEQRRHSDREEHDLESLPVQFPPVESHADRAVSETSPKSASSGSAAAAAAATTPLQLYQCGVCSQSYGSPAELKPHLVTHGISSSQRPVRCGACLKAFRYVSDLMQHTVVHTGERNHACGVCQATFTKASSLKGHMKVHTGERPYQCARCPSRFKHASHLKEHERTHSGERPYRCQVCQVSYTSSGQLRLHRLLHTGGRRFKCDLCAVEFNQRLHLDIHRRVHTGEKPYPCPLCACRYRYKSSLKSHTLKAHGQDHQRLRCPHCVATFGAPEHLAKHLKSHQKDRKTFRCPECPAAFLTLISLTHHGWSHTGEKPFKCDLCPASFRDTTSYRRHKTVHVGLRAFRCQLCCASFRLMSHLSCHLKVHCQTSAPSAEELASIAAEDLSSMAVGSEPRNSTPSEDSEDSAAAEDLSAIAAEDLSAIAVVCEPQNSTTSEDLSAIAVRCKLQSSTPSDGAIMAEDLSAITVKCEPQTHSPPPPHSATEGSAGSHFSPEEEEEEEAMDFKLE